MEKNGRKFRKYAYVLTSIVLLVLITAEISQIEDYHSSSGFINVDVTNSIALANQTDFIVITKLPGVSVNIIMYPQFSLPPPNDHITAKVPANNSYASISLSNFNSSQFLPSIIVKFNSSSGYGNKLQFNLGQHINTTLTSYNPVSILSVPVSELPGFYPSVVKTLQYDYLIIQVNNTATLQYTEVSR